MNRSSSEEDERDAYLGSLTRDRSPPPRRYAPRSTTSGNLSFGTRQTSPHPSSISSLNLGPPALPKHRSASRKSSTTSFSYTEPYNTWDHDKDIFGDTILHRSASRTRKFNTNTLASTAPLPLDFGKDIFGDTLADRSASRTRNALTRVRRSEYQPERESPREVMQRSMRDARVAGHARGPERTVPIDSVEQRRTKHRSGRHRARGERVEQQGFRKWYWGK